MKLQAQLLDITYKIIENTAIIYLYCLSDRGKNIIAKVDSFKPYFYVIPQEKESDLLDRLKAFKVIRDEKTIKITKVEEIRRDNQKVYKVFTNIPSNIPILKDEVKIWPEVKGKREFDIAFTRRYLIDNDIEPLSWIQIIGIEEETTCNEDIFLHVKEITKVKSKDELSFNMLAFDLEVLDEKIIMASFYSKDFRKVLCIKDFPTKQKYVKVVNNEKELLEKLVEIIVSRKVNVLLGYNTDRFDFEIIKERAEKLGVTLNLGVDGSKLFFVKRGISHSARINGRINIDLYAFVENLIQQELKAETLSLNSVANELIGEKKYDIDWDEMESSWKKEQNLATLSKYCLKDSELTYKLGEKLVPVVFSLSVLIGQIPFEVSRERYSQVVEQILIKHSHVKKTLIPNRPSKDEILKRRGNSYAGAFVLEPKGGIYKNLAMLDYRSLYPSIIVSHNISPETLNCDCCEPKDEIMGNYFCKLKKGFIPEVLEKIMKERFTLKSKLKKLKSGSQEYQDMYTRQVALKYVLNATYGYLAYSGARWYCNECASAITGLGRKYITETIEAARKTGLNVIYSDTDSVLLQGENIHERAQDFLIKTNKKLPKFMEIEIEDFYQSGVFTSTSKGVGIKKRYALLSENGELRIKGLERVRRDWCALAKDLQEQVIKLVLTDQNDAAVKLVQETVDALKKKEIALKKLQIYTKLKKTIDKYEIMTPHVQAAKRAIERGLEIKVGQTIRYVITEGEGRISDKAEIIKFATNYDSEYYIENQILPAALRILRVLGYSEDDFLMKGKQTSLSKFAG